MLAAAAHPFRRPVCHSGDHGVQEEKVNSGGLPLDVMNFFCLRGDHWGLMSCARFCSHHSGPWKLRPRWRLHFWCSSRQLSNEGIQNSPSAGQSTGGGGDFERATSNWKDDKVELVQFAENRQQHAVTDILRPVCYSRTVSAVITGDLARHGSFAGLHGT